MKMMRYIVEVPNTSEFSKALREAYTSDYGFISVKVLPKSKYGKRVSIIQKDDGLNPVDLIDPVLEEHGGCYV